MCLINNYFYRHKMIKKILSAACLATLTAASLPAAAALLTFDDRSSDIYAINNGYQGFNWDNFWTLDGAANHPGSGYDNGTVSLNNVAFNAYGDPATISNAGGFTLNNGYFTAAWDNGLTVWAVGTTLDNQTLNHQFTLNTDGPTNILFNWENLASVTFSTSSTQFALDNLTVNEAIGAVPEPATLAILGLGLLGFAAARRRKQ